MKRIVILIACFLTVCMMHAQKLESGDISILKNLRRLNVEIDFSSANICGVSEEELATYEYFWPEFKKSYLSSFCYGYNSTLESASTFYNLPFEKRLAAGLFEDEYTLIYIVEKIQYDGDADGYAIILDRENTEVLRLKSFHSQGYNQWVMPIRDIKTTEVPELIAQAMYGAGKKLGSHITSLRIKK